MYKKQGILSIWPYMKAKMPVDWQNAIHVLKFKVKPTFPFGSPLTQFHSHIPLFYIGVRGVLTSAFQNIAHGS